MRNLGPLTKEESEHAVLVPDEMHDLAIDIAGEVCSWFHYTIVLLFMEMESLGEFDSAVVIEPRTAVGTTDKLGVRKIFRIADFKKVRALLTAAATKYLENLRHDIYNRGVKEAENAGDYGRSVI